MTTPLRQTGRTDTVVMAFDVVHDPDDSSRYDIENPTYQWHKPLRVDAKWTFDPAFDTPWKLVHVTVYARLRDRQGKLANRHVFELHYTAAGTKYDNMQYLPEWLAADVAACTPAHNPKSADATDRAGITAHHFEASA